MSVLRPILAAILTIAFVGYGVTAAAPAHAHIDGDFHAVHAISVDTDHGGHHGGGPIDDDHGTEGGDLSGPDHKETGLHTHGAPQFTENDAVTVLMVAAFRMAAPLLEPSALRSSRRAAPPFKPPRSFL